MPPDPVQRRIAVRLGVGYETVRPHLRRIADKLSLDTGIRAAVVAAARKRGLLDTTGVAP